jgi:hypothetical protein
MNEELVRIIEAFINTDLRVRANVCYTIAQFSYKTCSGVNCTNCLIKTTKQNYSEYPRKIIEVKNILNEQ